MFDHDIFTQKEKKNRFYFTTESATQCTQSILTHINRRLYVLVCQPARKIFILFSSILFFDSSIFSHFFFFSLRKQKMIFFFFFAQILSSTNDVITLNCMHATTKAKHSLESGWNWLFYYKTMKNWGKRNRNCENKFQCHTKKRCNYYETKIINLRLMFLYVIFVLWYFTICRFIVTNNEFILYPFFFVSLFRFEIF